MSENAISTKNATYLDEMELLLVDPHCNTNVLLTEARMVASSIAAIGIGDLHTDPRVLLSDFFSVSVVVAASGFAIVMAIAVIVVAFALLSHLGCVHVVFWFLQHGKETRL